MDYSRIDLMVSDLFSVPRLAAMDAFVNVHQGDLNFIGIGLAAHDLPLLVI